MKFFKVLLSLPKLLAAVVVDSIPGLKQLFKRSKSDNDDYQPWEPNSIDPTLPTATKNQRVGQEQIEKVRAGIFISRIRNKMTAMQQTVQRLFQKKL